MEAQTETVWRQANSYNLSRLIYVNKMDRQGASFFKCINSVRKRLKGWGIPLILQLPLFSSISSDKKYAQIPQAPVNVQDGVFDSVLDIVNGEILDWSENVDGSVVRKTIIADPELLKIANENREELIESLSDIDDEIVQVFMDCDGVHEKVTAKQIDQALRRVTISGKGVPVFCGASFKNIGVQPVLDGVINYLPSPNEVAHQVAKDESGKEVLVKIDDPKMRALAFKITHDQQRGNYSFNFVGIHKFDYLGPMVFVRVYSGKLDVRSVLQIAQPKSSKPLDKERAGVLMELYADDYESVPVIEAGNIGAIVGLKNVKTGDTLVSAKDSNPVFLDSITIPPPVFVRSVQVDSLSEEKSVQIALQHLLREDPSLSLSMNEDTGQTLLSGMGELHLEIAGERLLDVYKAKCTLGRVEIAYRETIAEGAIQEKFLYDKEFFGKIMKCEISLVVERMGTEEGIGGATNNLDECVLTESKIYAAGGDAGSTTKLSLSGYPTIIEMNQAVQDGVNIALSRGPKLGFPVSMVSVKLLSLGVFSSHFTTLAAIRSAAHACVKKMLATNSGFLLEPVMTMTVTVPSKYVGAVSRDLSSQRRGMILDVEGIEEERTKINCEAPLANLVGYASSLRGQTQGTGEWIMDLKGYQLVKRDREEEVVKMMQGQ